MAEDEADYVIAAFRDADEWQLAELKASLGHDVEELSEALARLHSDDVLAMVSVNEDYVVLLRRVAGQVRILLSDVTAVSESDLAVDIADLLDLPDPEDDDEPQPGGDLELLTDLGVTAADLTDLCSDDEVTPDEFLLDLAERLGFAEDLEDVLG
ncbi:MAG TPA: tRNA adenosine deaminase-associated protein [Aeromicrobium sp.]|nr:tRNA adenosine deaminase-associated protein [Aeromicrobium sp.]